MNLYNITQSLPKSPIKIEEIIDLVQQGSVNLSRQRKMQIKVEIEEVYLQLMANGKLAQYDYIMSSLISVRFTREFGTIVIGARKQLSLRNVSTIKLV
jgi:hypothetical protein